MTRLHTMSDLDSHLNTDICLDRADLPFKQAHLLAVFQDGRFEVLPSNSDDIALLDINDPNLKVYTKA